MLADKFGRHYDFVLFVVGDEVIACRTGSDTGARLPSHFSVMELERTMCMLHRNNLRVRLLWYVDKSGKYTLPDVDELLEAQELDY